MKNRFIFIDRIVFSLLIVAFSFSFSFAENDINKLSTKDREQCLKMAALVNKYARKKDNWQDTIVRSSGYEFRQIKVCANHIYPKLNYKKEIKITFHDCTMEDISYLIKKDNKIIGISEIIPNYHGASTDRYNKGYLVNISEYYGKDIAYIDWMLEEPNSIEKKYGKNYINKNWNNLSKNLTHVVFTRRKHDIDMSYIKVNNCFVEDYYLKGQK